MVLKKTYETYSNNNYVIRDKEISKEKLDELRNKLINDNLTVCRYNDGEWIWMLKANPLYDNRYVRRLGGDHNKQIEMNSITSKMLDIVKSKPEYYISIDSFSLTKNPLKDLVTPYAKELPNLIGSGVFNIWSMQTAFQDLFSEANKRKCIFIGPAQFKSLKIKIDKFFVTDFRNAIFQSEKIISDVEKYLQDSFEDRLIILYSCSFVAKVSIDYFYKKYGNKITQLDLGASICPFVDLKIRPWHEAMSKELKKLNLEQF